MHRWQSEPTNWPKGGWGSLSLSLSLSLSISIYLNLSIPIYIYLHLSLSICLSIHPSIHVSIYLCLSIFVSFWLCLSISTDLKIYLSMLTMKSSKGLHGAMLRRWASWAAKKWLKQILHRCSACPPCDTPKRSQNLHAAGSFILDQCFWAWNEIPGSLGSSWGYEVGRGHVFYIPL